MEAGSTSATSDPDRMCLELRQTSAALAHCYCCLKYLGAESARIAAWQHEIAVIMDQNLLAQTCQVQCSRCVASSKASMPCEAHRNERPQRRADTRICGQTWKRTGAAQ